MTTHSDKTKGSSGNPCDKVVKVDVPELTPTTRPARAPRGIGATRLSPLRARQACVPTTDKMQVCASSARRLPPTATPAAADDPADMSGDGVHQCLENANTGRHRAEVWQGDAARGVLDGVWTGGIVLVSVIYVVSRSWTLDNGPRMGIFLSCFSSETSPWALPMLRTW